MPSIFNMFIQHQEESTQRRLCFQKKEDFGKNNQIMPRREDSDMPWPKEDVDDNLCGFCQGFSLTQKLQACVEWGDDTVACLAQT
jgi:hypothetical protein